jgi:hypothetical protein
MANDEVSVLCFAALHFIALDHVLRGYGGEHDPAEYAATAFQIAARDLLFAEQVCRIDV